MEWYGENEEEVKVEEGADKEVHCGKPAESA